MNTSDTIAARIQNHRCYTHPVFRNWVSAQPDYETIGALFHQIQSFCSSTRPGRNFPAALKDLGLGKQSDLMQEIVNSEEDHGPELATMAGHIVNKAAGKRVFHDLANQSDIEGTLKQMSDRLLGNLPGYDKQSGLAVQTRRAIQILERRDLTDRDSTLRNMGTTLALEMISNRHLIPGEKECLVDSNVYKVSMDEPEMHYLLEHWGEIGAEQQHEQNAMAALNAVHDDREKTLIIEGADDFLNALAAVWDLLDSSLITSGYRVAA